jgi:glycerophosphoryl diester phosphodiesterase
MAADDALFSAAARLRSPGIALHHAAYTFDVADRAARADLAVAVWTVNDPAEGRRVRDLGAATLMTDFPAKMRRALTESAR